mmetsp:Transcript_47221/g.109232  ORF Transcript_47221/g.109232 Transcript_47221/m.109232 type:complete len:127 (-) Transcript_47221:288-668(-)
MRILVLVADQAEIQPRLALQAVLATSLTALAQVMSQHLQLMFNLRRKAPLAGYVHRRAVEQQKCVCLRQPTVVFQVSAQHKSFRRSPALWFTQKKVRFQVMALPLDNPALWRQLLRSALPQRPVPL